MVIRDRVNIGASPARVWEILRDPELMELWNPKCTHCRVGGNTVRRGLRYQATFRLGGKEQEADCEVVECDPEATVKTRFSGPAFSRGGHVDELFRLAVRGECTRLIHEVDFSQSGLPWVVRALAKLLSLVGYHAGKSSLEGIKALAEEEPP